MHIRFLFYLCHLTTLFCPQFLITCPLPFLSFPFLSFPFLSFPFLSYPFLFYPCFFLLWRLSLLIPSYPHLFLTSSFLLDGHQSSEAVRKAASSLILAPDSPNAVRICIAVPMTSKGTKMGALHQFISTFIFIFFFYFFFYYYSFSFFFMFFFLSLFLLLLLPQLLFHALILLLLLLLLLHVFLFFFFFPLVFHALLLPLLLLLLDGLVLLLHVLLPLLLPRIIDANYSIIFPYYLHIFRASDRKPFLDEFVWFFYEVNRLAFKPFYFQILHWIG